MRKCKTCKTEKELTEFQSSGLRNGQRLYKYHCKECSNKIDRENAKINGWKQSSTRPNLKLWFNSYKETLSCLDCNLSFKDQPWLCDFHHRDPTTKLYSIGFALSGAKSRALIQLELAKCDPLCANCHRTRHNKDLETKRASYIRKERAPLVEYMNQA